MSNQMSISLKFYLNQIMEEFYFFSNEKDFGVLNFENRKNLLLNFLNIKKNY